jgi:hypothetical protein
VGNLLVSDCDVRKFTVELTRDDVLLCSQEVADGFLLDVGMILLEVVCQSERHHRQAGVVICTCFSLVVLFLALFVFQIALLSVNVANLVGE